MRWSALNPWKGLAGLPRESWLIALATLVNRAGTMVMPFLVLFLTRDRGLAATRAGFAIAFYGAAVLMAIPLFHSYASILLAMALLALASEPVRPATMALVSHLAPPQRRRQ